MRIVKLYNKVHTQVDKQVAGQEHAHFYWQLREQLWEPVELQVWDQVYMQVGLQVWDQVAYTSTGVVKWRI